MKTKDYIKRNYLKEKSEQQLVNYLCELATRDFGTTFINDVEAWHDDLETALNNGTLLFQQGNECLYECIVEVYDGTHSECYPFYVLDTFDGDELASEEYYI